MGRLIDADELTKGMMQYVRGQKTIGQIIDEQSTAYDVNAVVKQLEERTSFLKDCTKYGNQTSEQQTKSYDTMMMYEVADLVDDLIEIVRGGGTQ